MWAPPSAACLLIVFGFAISLDVKNIGLAVYDGDKSALSRDFIEDFTRSKYFTLRPRPSPALAQPRPQPWRDGGSDSVTSAGEAP